MAPGRIPEPHAPARIVELDSLRCLAIVPVILSHMSLIPGGWLGVDVFFGISGALVTWQLVREHDRSGGVRRGAFLLRRAVRIWVPTVAMVLLVAAVLCTRCTEHVIIG